MFVDYLRLTYLIPRELPEDEKLPPGMAHAERIYARHLAGETRIDGCHLFKAHHYPEGLRLIAEFGGSQCGDPMDLGDFFRRFKWWRDWTVGRMDLAENVEHATRAQIRSGQAREWEDRWTVEEVDGSPVRTWTGCMIGKRGTAGSYFRIYDARAHRAGHAAKVARFGTYEFWRVEYELSREFFRRNGYQTLRDFSPEILEMLWQNETYKKGLFINGTSEYHAVNRRDETEVSEEMSQQSRLGTIMQMVNKLDKPHLQDLLRIVQDTLTEMENKERTGSV